MKQVSEPERILKLLEGKQIDEVFGILDGVEGLEDDTLRKVIDVKYAGNMRAIEKCYVKYGLRLVSKNVKELARISQETGKGFYHSSELII